MSHVSFTLPETVDVAAIESALARPVQVGPPAVTDRRFYDTFDGRLHAAGLALAHQRGALVVLDATGRQVATAPVSSAPRRLFTTDLPEGPVRDRLAPEIEMRVLLPTTRVRTRRRALAVLDGEEKTVVRLYLDEATGLPAQLHVSGVRGYDKELSHATGALEALGLAAAAGSLVAAAMKRDGLPPAGVSSKPGVKLKPGQTGAVAAAKLCRRLADVVAVNLPGTLADTDSEFLHDLRVAVRRTRSLQRELRDVFDPETLAGYRAEFRWLQAVTGPTRDLDVYLLDFDDFRAALGPAREDDLEPLRALLVKRRAAERRKMARALRSPRAEAALGDWRKMLGRLAKGKEGGPAAQDPIETIANARIATVYRQMAKAGGKITDDTPAEALHDLRKKGKELRYLLEFFAGLYPDSVTKPMVGSLKALQDTLGRFQDREVQAELIASMGDDIRSAPDGARALMAMGQLVDRLEQQQAAARAEFAERFAAFASAEQRELVKETFR